MSCMLNILQKVYLKFLLIIGANSNFIFSIFFLLTLNLAHALANEKVFGVKGYIQHPLI